MFIFYFCFSILNVLESGYVFFVVQLPTGVSLFAAPWTTACQASLSLTISRSLPKFMSLCQWCYQAISSSDVLVSFCPQSFSASETFVVSRLLPSDDQNTGVPASTSVLPMSIQGWFPLSLTGFISLQSKWLSGVFSNTTVQRHQFFDILPSLWSSSHNRTWPLGRP